MLRRLLGAAALLSAVLLAAGEVPLYLVTPRSPSAMEERAAQELMYFYKAIYRRPLLRIPEAESSGRAAIFLGRTDFAVQNRIDAGTFDQEEWLLKTAGSSLIIAGGSSVGILYGVYQLLENLGVAFLAPDETVIPAAKKDFPSFDERGRPAFAGRIIRDGLPAVLRHDTSPASQWAETGVVESYRLWKLRTRINGGAEKGVPLYWTGRINDICHKPESRTMALYVPPSLFDSRPDFFAMDAEGFRGRGDVCMANPEVRKTALEALRKMIRSDRAERNSAEWSVVYDVSRSDDGAPYCRCPDCRRIARQHGSDGGLLMDFANSLARGIAKEYPDVFLRVPQNAVSGKNGFPGKISPEKNVLLLFDDSFRPDIFRPLKNLSASSVVSFFMDWTPLGSPLVKMLRTRWNGSGNAFQPPRVETVFDTLRPDLDVLLQHGVNALIIDGETDNASPQNFMMLNYFVASRLMVDPAADPEALARLFIRGYYGEKAAPVIEKYFFVIRKGVAQDPLKNAGPRGGEWHFTSPELLLGLYRDFSRAAAGAENPRFARRIRSELITPVWSVLARWPRYERTFSAAGIARGRLIAECREYARARVRRFPCDRPEKGDGIFEEKFRSVETDPVLPKRFQKVPARERRCVTAPFFRTDAASGVSVVGDPDSLQERAVRSAHPDPARHGVNRILPGTDNVRTTAFRVTGRNGEKNFVLTEIPRDEQYHWYRIPGPWTVGEHSTFSGHGGGIFCSLAHWFDPLRSAKGNTWSELWFSVKFTGPDYVPGSKAENAVYVDAVVALHPWEDQ